MTSRQERKDELIERRKAAAEERYGEQLRIKAARAQQERMTVRMLDDVSRGVNYNPSLLVATQGHIGVRLYELSESEAVSLIELGKAVEVDDEDLIARIVALGGSVQIVGD